MSRFLTGKTVINVILLGIFCLSFCPREAFSSTECGIVDRNVVRKVYREARNVGVVVDVMSALDKFCDSAETMYQWEKEQPRENLRGGYQSLRDSIIKSAQRDMVSLRGQLIVIRGLKKKTVVSVGDVSIEKVDGKDVKKLANGEKAINKINLYSSQISQYGDQLDVLMENY